MPAALGVRDGTHLQLGIGGLGHLAIQFLAKWGCAVTAISTTPDKEPDARRFGAADFLATDGEGALREAANSFDFVLSTVSADLPWDDYLGILRPGGTLCVVGVPSGPITTSAMSLIPAEKRIVGGVTASPVRNRQMLEFAARHGITAAVETFPIADVERALDRVRRGAARYRAVLEL